MKRAAGLKFLLAAALGLLATGCATDTGSGDRAIAYPGYAYGYYDPFWGPYYNSLYWPDYSYYSYDAFCSPFCGGFYGGFYGYYPAGYYPGYYHGSGYYHGGHPAYPGPGWPHPPWHGGAPRPVGGPVYRPSSRFGGAGGHPATRSPSFSRSRGR